MKTHKVIYFFFLFVFFSCEKNRIPISSDSVEAQLPDPYNTNKNSVFGCLVDGNVWIPQNGSIISVNHIVYSYNQSTGSFSISAEKNIDEVDQEIFIGASFRDTGYYQLKHGSLSDLKLVDSNSRCVDYCIDSSKNSMVHIEQLKLSTPELLIIGTFGFTTLNQCQDTIKITDGRFRATIN